jgi:hypothetical protein
LDFLEEGEKSVIRTHLNPVTCDEYVGVLKEISLSLCTVAVFIQTYNRKYDGIFPPSPHRNRNSTPATVCREEAITGK